jgi:ribose transport system ATP-binding protein
LLLPRDLRQPVQSLSGGNQQKVALAKWLPLLSSILLSNDPTSGADVK